MKNKRWLRSVAFILLLVTALLGVFHCYSLPKNYDTKNMATFDEQPKNVIDGIFLGTSVVAQGWTPPIAWGDYGLSIFHLSTSVHPFGVATDYIDYARKTQDIKYVLIDLHGLRTDAIITSLRPAKVRAAYLNIPDMASRWAMLGTLMEYAEDVYEYYGKPKNNDDIVDLEDFSYYFPFLAFHSRWEDGLVKADYVTVKNDYMGADSRKTVFETYDCTGLMKLWDYELDYEPDEFQKAQLQRLFDYGDKNNIEMIFVNVPSFRNKDEQKEIACLVDYCRQQGYKTLDLASEEMAENMDLNLKEDFVNKGHLNSKGAAKVTRYICEFLIENGFYIDHKGDERYAHFDEIADKYYKFYTKGWDKAKKK